MINSFIIGTYWGSRAEPLPQVRDKIVQTLKILAETNEQFADWYEGSMFGGTQVTLGLGQTGSSAMWPSNRMHNTIKDREDPSKHFHHLFVPNNTSTVFRLGFQR